MSKFIPTKANYVALRGKQVKIGRVMCTVTFVRIEGQSGSWMRGFKFHSSEWAMLKRTLKGTKHYKPTQYSMDHGKTWHATALAARKLTKQGKLKLKGETRKEFAFDAIQKINKEYDY